MLGSHKNKHSKPGRKSKPVSIIILIWKFLIFFNVKYVTSKQTDSVTSKQIDIQHLADTSRIIARELLLISDINDRRLKCCIIQGSLKQ